ncbi:vacuolar protein sorting 13B isoform X2 [Lycorma delicatula]|uniref:vacuolar protein sorting 13B isoform X2 n=1 Tax=Lycorma delicatula TaxID=130591 RepID=UPI003F5179A0
MFRIESYITPIILSYVDRYIKNFRIQDAQVSLWEGDGVFHNLDLDLEVLEQELNLPFSFVSGHINELLIHVPWTRINSEPVRITINTIECVMKLRSPGARPHGPSERSRKQTTQKTEETVAPPSYTSNLVNKIICNLSVTCNNFILKYVEEDIVFSMNIKTLNFESVNSKWEPAYLELSPSQLILRKLISLSDVTICLDKRNASGRIESYLEPLLYRCFLTMRLSRTYVSISANRASSTRLDVFCEKMAFTLSDPQVPMLMRMVALALALQRKQLTPKMSIVTSSDSIQDSSIEEVFVDETPVGMSWGTWVWSWVSSVPYLVGEDGSSLHPQCHTMQLGFYIETFSLALKLCNTTVDLQGCLMELESQDSDWTNVLMGISHISIVPSGDCCCGTSEQNQLTYLTCGSRQDTFLSGSLFGNTTSRRIQEKSWDYHIATVTETLLLEKTPAVAVDYLYAVENCQPSETDEDEENTCPPVERVLIRHVADGVVVRVCSGLIHRMQMLLKSASTYDYVPYTTLYPASEKSQESVQEVSVPENTYIPQYMSRYTLFHPVFEIYPANHSPVQASCLGRKLSRSQKRAQQASSSVLPSACIIVEWSCLDAKLTRPLNPDKVQSLSALPSTALKELISDAETRLSLKVVGVCFKMQLPSVPHMKVLELSSFSLDWTNQELIPSPVSNVLTKMESQIEQLTLTSSKPKLLLLIEILNSLIMSNNKQRYQTSYETLFNTSLIQDAAATIDMVYLKLNMDKLSALWVQTGISESIQICVDSCQAFIIQLADKGPNLQTMILLGPHANDNKPLMTGLFQKPLELQTRRPQDINLTSVQSHQQLNLVQPQHGPVLMFCVNGIRLSVDPLLYTWLLYTPLPIVSPFSRPLQTQLSFMSTNITSSSTKSRKISESSGSAPKRALTPQESVHSSSERETTPSLQLSSQQPITEFVKESTNQTFVERVTALYPVWQSIVVYGHINELCIFFPNISLCSSLPQPMESSLQAGLKKSSPVLQVAVVKLPSIALLCSSLKQAPFELPLPVLPVILPSTIWTADKCNFPWSLKVCDLQCYTLHGATQLKLLKPLSATCTVGVSTKYNGSILTSLALCIHLDTTAISISMSEEQVALVASLAVIQAQVLETLMPVWSNEHRCTDDLLFTAEPPVGSEDSLSTSQPGDENSESGVAGGVKLTGWMQWTLARFTLTVYNPPSKSSPDSLKLSLDVEDIFFSLDIERVYHKLKLKVSTASIQHYSRSSASHPWVLGPFQGLVMRGHDPDGVGALAPGISTGEDATSNSSGFLTATLTRACCSNLHSKLGTPSKASKLLQKGVKEDKFVTEIAVKLQPLDIVLSPNTIGTILNVVNPLLKLSHNRAPRPVIQPQSAAPLTSFTSANLPLLYLDLMAVRIVLPAASGHCQHDVVLIQFDGITTSPQPENPICRVPVRLDIYQAAEKHRILGVPGSEIEDRQYQVDIIAITVSTGVWNELKSMLIKDAVPSLQNPALDWNEGRRPSSTPPALENMLTVIPPTNICFVFAPAIIYKENTVVCGHSIEVNAVSEVLVTLSTDQIELCGVLANEISNVVPENVENDVGIATPIMIPQPPAPFIPLQFDSIDSGLETFSSSPSAQQRKGSSDFHAVSVHSVSVNRALSMSPSTSAQPTCTSFSSFTKRSAPKERFVPLEMLITGSAISCSLCKSVDSVRFTDVIPLIHLRFSQPHVFLSKLGESKSCQASIYDLSIHCGKNLSASPVVLSQSQLSARDFSLSLFETRSGEPHPVTGIPPALLTLKWTQTGSKPVKLEVDLGRPFRITIQISVLEFVEDIYAEIMLKWKASGNLLASANKKCHQEESKEQISEGKEKSQIWSTQLKTYFNCFSSISLSTQKILLAILSQRLDSGNVGVSVDKIILNSGIAQHTVTNHLSLQSLSINSDLGNQTKLVLNPWSLSLKIVLLWENWLSMPILQITVRSDVFSVDISPKRLQCLQEVYSEYSNYWKLSSSSAAQSSRNCTLVLSGSDQLEQHYKEDLQAGAFQFIDGGSDQEELPLTYQVVFSSGAHRNPTMAWRYPQPRALTRLYIQPLPFRDSQPDDKIDCVLQFWSDPHGAYRDYINFSLCESAACTVALPSTANIPVVAATWRVVLGISSNPHPLPVNVKALAACLRVDSYFCPSLIPNIQVAATLAFCNLTLWSEASGSRPMPAQFSRYRPDGCLPLNHCIFTMLLNQSDIAFTSWSHGTQLVRINGTARLDVLNYRTLNLHCCIEPFKFVSSLNVSPDATKYLNVVSEAITCRLGPSVCHTLATAYQLCSQYSTNTPHHFIIVTPYVVCNNSCLPIRFGQDETDEIITLEYLQCHLYSWYSARQPLLLRFSLALTAGRCHWSKPIQISKDSSICVTVCDEESRDWNLVITMKTITNFITQVTVSGQLIVRNALDSTVELLVSSERQNSLVVPPQTTPPGVILSPHFIPFLRIRFPGISFTWSGLVSLKWDGSSQTKDWLVKIPLQERGDFRCLWCHIIWDGEDESGQIVVLLNNMYRIKSELPCSATVKLETPDLNVSETISVKGRGAVQDLNCHGTPDVSHKLKFQLDGRLLSSSPEIPLSYSVFEGHNPNSRPLSSVDINELLDKLLDKSEVNTWLSPSPEWNMCDWISASQPDTVVHVKVTYGQEWIEPNSLQVGLEPWALLLNSLGCQISLRVSDKLICSLPHLSVVAPPPLESTFHLGLYIGTSVYLSTSLQLSRDKAFYMPRISGLIPLKGYVNTTVDCGSVISFINIHSSEMNNVRLIHVRSSFVITNFSSKVLKIAAVVVGRRSNQIKEHRLPPNVDYHTFTLKPQKPTGVSNKAFPITEWLTISKDEESMIPYLAVSEGGDYSCPVPVPQSTERQSEPVLVPCNRDLLHIQHVNSMLLLCSEQRDGQTFLTLWDQPFPPYIIHNFTRSSIIFAKAVSEKGGEAVPYSADWAWQLRLESGCSADYQLPGEVENLPDKMVSKLPLAVIATDYVTRPLSGYHWSEGISLSPCRGRLIGLPGTSGINVAVSKRGFTTHVTLSHTSHTEISPLDVRSRLSREAQLGNFRRSDSNPGLEDITCFVQGVTLIFAVEGEFACDCREIAAFVMDDVAFTIQPTTHPHSDVKELLVRMTLGDIQLDNQEYNRGGYDFPVVLMTQVKESNEPQPVQFSVKGSAITLVEMSRIKGSAVDLVVILDVNSYKVPAILMQDASLTLSPLQLYIEDTYILELKDHLLKAIPSYTLTDIKSDKNKKNFFFNPVNTSVASTDVVATTSAALSVNSGSLISSTNPADDELSGVLFFNLKQNASDEKLEDKEEELFNVSEPDVEMHGFGFIPEVHPDNETNINKEKEEQDDSKNVKDILFESSMPWLQTDIFNSKEEIEETVDNNNDIPVPREVVLAAQELAYPLRLRSLTISPLEVLVSLHTSTTFYIGLDHSPLNFSSFQRGNLVTTAYRLGHALTLHYFLGAFYGSAWALVSLEMLGAPGGLARTVGSGLRDFVSLPYQGIQQGPRAFLTGIAHGSASLMRHVTAGTLTSVTKLAASWARTLDRLTLNQDDLRLTEEARRLRPQGLTQGLMHGLTEFGISLLGAMGSLVHQPLQYAVSNKQDQSFINSIGYGVMGVFTRPLSGAAELVALTGEGLLYGAGWSNAPKARSQPRPQHSHCGTESMLKYSWKVLKNSEHLLLAMEASSSVNYDPVVLLLTKSYLYIINLDKLTVIKSVSLSELHITAHHSDPTLIVFRILPLEAEAEALSRTRLAQFVRDSQRVIVGDQDVLSQTGSVDTSTENEPPICYYVNPELRDYFITFVSFARRHILGRDFPVS